MGTRGRTLSQAVALFAAAILSGAAGVAGHAAVLAPRGASPATAGTISTVAGGVGGPVLATRIDIEPGCASMAAGNGGLYFSSQETVRAVNEQADWLSTPVGTGSFDGPDGLGAPASQANVIPCGVALDHSGNLLIALGTRIGVVPPVPGTFYGQVMTAGNLYSVAGNGGTGFGGDGGPATQAEFSDAFGVAVAGGTGNLAITDGGNSRVRVVAEVTGTFYGRAMTAGDIYTVAGNGTKGFGGDGGPGTGAALDQPADTAVDADGNLVITDAGNNRIRVVANTAGTFYGRAMTAGDIYTIAGTGTAGYSGDGGPATAAELSQPGDAAVDRNGNPVIVDSGNERVRVVAVAAGTFYGQAMTAGDIYTITGTGTAGYSGDGGPAAAAELRFPQDVTVDSRGDVLIGDTGNHRVRLIAAHAGTFYGQAMTAGDIYPVAGNGHPVGLFGDSGYYGDGGLAVRAQMFTPYAVALDGAGDVFVADMGNSRVRLVAARTGRFFGQDMTVAHIYTVAGDDGHGTSGDGGLATKSSLANPRSVAVDGAGNLLIADTLSNRIRVVAARGGTFYGQKMTTGHIYALAGTGTAGFAGDGGPAAAAELDEPDAVAVAGGSGNLVIADTANERVRVVAETSGTFYGRAMTAGDVYTVAGTGTRGFSGDGGPATAAELSVPRGVVVDGAGNLVITDTYNDQVRVVAGTSGTFYGQAMTAGDIYSVAGTGRIGSGGDGGPATQAQLARPTSTGLDGQGNLLIADTLNDRVRVVAETSGTFYGQAMTAGDIYSVAGTGQFGFGGDGGPATSAEIFNPTSVATGPGGSLVISDTANERIRQVAG